LDEKKLENINKKILSSYKKKKSSAKKKIKKRNKKYTSHVNNYKKKVYKTFSFENFSNDKNVLLYHPMKKNTFWQSSPFGIRFNRLKKKYEMHGGVDFAAPIGTPVYSAEAGVVIEITNKNTGYGKSIVIEHESNVKTRYAHLSKILVMKGDRVQPNHLIGLVGATGNTRGVRSASHLHFEVIIDRKKYNPLIYLRNATH
jgi:murein DD-endopeptidase MepM/ murein hydrolase activator NlpD